MKTLVLILAFASLNILISTEADASHILGGQITAEAVSGQNLTYKIHFTIYSGKGSQVSFGSYEIFVGSGRPVVVENEEFKREFLDEDSLFVKVTLEILHTYPGPGEYLLSYREFNRDQDIVNMHNSVTTPFYMETKLTIDPLSGINSTPVLSDPESLLTNVKTKFMQNINATDPNGDSLSYELVPPKQDKAIFAEGYFLPHRLGINSVNPPTREDGSFPAVLKIEEGRLIWDAPAYGGKYTIAFKVKEWRKIDNAWKEIGYITRDFTVYVADTLNNSNGADYITATEEETEIQDAVLYPNPTGGKFHLKISEPWINSQLSVQDITGKLIYHNAVNQHEMLLELPSLSSGLYILTLQKGMKRKVFTFVKQ